MNDPLSLIFITTLLSNNFVLAMFLGLCPFLGVLGRLDTAFPMGVATTFVMVVASLCAYGLNLLLIYFNLEFLRLISYIVVIASSVQLVEMVMKKYSPALFRALGMGAGFTIGLLALGGTREILGAGKFFGMSLFGADFQPWVVMVLHYYPERGAG